MARLQIRRKVTICRPGFVRSFGGDICIFVGNPIYSSCGDDDGDDDDEDDDDGDIPGLQCGFFFLRRLG